MNVKKSILVIDDNGINRVIPGLILRPFGWSVYEADSGFEALGIIGVADFSFVLLDISMPNMSGVDVFLYFKKNGLIKILNILHIQLMPRQKIWMASLLWDSMLCCSSP